MNKKPKEQAIEKIANIITNNIWKELDENANPRYVYEQDFESISEKILNALPIEFVDDDTEPMEGDIIKAFYKKEAGHGDYIEEEFIERLPFKERLKYLNEIEIIQRNGKPVINIKDIKEIGDE